MIAHNIGTVRYLPQLIFFKPTTKLTRINWGNRRNRAANPLQNPVKVLTHLLMDSEEWPRLVKNISKSDSINIMVPGLLFFLGHKHFYSKHNYGAGKDQQHSREEQNVKAKFYSLHCAWSSGNPNWVYALSSLNCPTNFNTYFKLVLDSCLK